MLLCPHRSSFVRAPTDPAGVRSLRAVDPLAFPAVATSTQVPPLWFQQRSAAMRGRDAERDFFLSRCRWTSQHIRSQDFSRSQVHMSKQLNGCENNNTQADSRIDTKTADTG